MTPDNPSSLLLGTSMHLLWCKPNPFYCVLQLYTHTSAWITSKIFIERIGFGLGLPWWLSRKESTCNAGDVAGATGLIPGLGRSPAEGNGNPLQHSGLGNPMDRGTWWATVHGVAELDTNEWLTTSTRLWTTAWRGSDTGLQCLGRMQWNKNWERSGFKHVFFQEFYINCLILEEISMRDE